MLVMERDTRTAVSQHGMARTPLPKKILTTLLIVVLTEPLCMTIFFPYMYYLIRDLHVGTEDQIGVYAGCLAAAFSLAQFGTSLIWGALSDRIGQRPILILGLLGNVVTLIWFGLSENYAMAFVSRFCCGMLNGNIGVAKSVVARISDETNVHVAFGFFNMTWSLGAIFGPLIGGYFHHPAETYPALFGSCPFLKRYPYFLPPFLSALLSLVGVALFFAWFPAQLSASESSSPSSVPWLAETDEHPVDVTGPVVEVLPSFANHSHVVLLHPAPRFNPLSLGHPRPGRWSDSRLLLSRPIRGRASVHLLRRSYASPREVGLWLGSTGWALQDSLSSPSLALSRTGSISDYRPLNQYLAARFGSSTRKRSMFGSSWLAPGSGEDSGWLAGQPRFSSVARSPSTIGRQRSVRLLTADPEWDVANEGAGMDGEGPVSAQSPLLETAEVSGPPMFSPDSVLCIVCYALLALGNVMVDEIYNLWCIEPPWRGGLGFRPADIGLSLAVLGVVDVLMQLLLFAPLCRVVGPVRLFQVSMLLYGPTVAILPVLALLAKGRVHPDAVNTDAKDSVFSMLPMASQVTIWLLLVADLSIKIAAQLCGYSTIMIMINNSATSLNSLGLINGVSQSAAALVRAAGPALAGIIWSWSLESGLGFPFDHYFLFELDGLLFVLAVLLSLRLPRTLDRRVVAAAANDMDEDDREEEVGLSLRDNTDSHIPSLRASAVDGDDFTRPPIFSRHQM